MAKIFVNYRREDERATAARIRDRLALAFGSENIFMDVHVLFPGQRFDKELENALSKTECLIAIVGPRWLDLLRERQASCEIDYAHQEIAYALKRGIVVIPVSVDGTALPNRQSLPEDIRDFVLCQKQEVSHERFDRDIEELIRSIKHISKKRKSTFKNGKKSVIDKGTRRIMTVISVIGALGLFFWSMSGENWAQKSYAFCAKTAYQRYGSGDSPGLTMQNLDEYMTKYRASEAACAQQLNKDGGKAATVMFYNSLFIALAPIPLLWIIVYIVLWTARWIARGF